MPPPKLRVHSTNAQHERRLKSQISSSLAAVLKTQPQLTPKEALWTVTTEILANNPSNPPENGKSPINDLPDEILGYIIQLGVELDEEWYDSDEDEDEDDWSDGDQPEDEGEAPNSADWESVEGSGESGESGDDSEEEGDEGDEDTGLPFQILASHVCKRWREVALGSHGLWATLEFSDQPRLEMAKAYIERANGWPLFISIDCALEDDIDEEDHPDHPLYGENQELRKQQRADGADNEHGNGCCEDEDRFLSHKDLEQILDLIEPEVSHWGTFDFRASTYGYVQLLLPRLAKLPGAPLLRRLELYHYEECEDFEFFSGDDKTSYLPFHGNAPNLLDVVFWGVHIDWDSGLSFLKGLETLDLSFHAKDVRPSYATFEKIIKASPQLKLLNLSLSGPALAKGVAYDSREGWGPTPLEIPSVIDFALQFHDPEYASALVQQLDMPNVRNVLLDFDQQDYTSLARTLVKPLHGKAKSFLSGVRNLKIAGLPCDMSSIEAMLNELTGLETFNLKCFSESEKLMFVKLYNPNAVPEVTAGSTSAIANTSTPTPELPKIFCPNLERLRTTFVAGSEIKKLIQERRALGAPPLKEIFMSIQDPISKKERRWVEDNVELLVFFEPSDSDEFTSDSESEAGESEEEQEEGDGHEEEPDIDGEAFPSPLARHLGRGRFRGRQHRGGGDLD